MPQALYLVFRGEKFTETLTAYTMRADRKKREIEAAVYNVCVYTS